MARVRSALLLLALVFMSASFADAADKKGKKMVAPRGRARTPAPAPAALRRPITGRTLLQEGACLPRPAAPARPARSIYIFFS